MAFTHLDDRGKAHIVDINAKPITQRTASARATVVLKFNALLSEELKAASVAAGCYGAKQTSSLIPLCHPIPLGQVTVEMIQRGRTVTVEATASATWRTGVEMEALTAVSMAALTLVAGLSTEARIDSTFILEKRGGESDPWGHSVSFEE